MLETMNAKKQTNTLTAAALSLGIDPAILEAFLPGLQGMTAELREREKLARTSKRTIDAICSEYRFTVNFPEIPPSISQ